MFLLPISFSLGLVIKDEATQGGKRTGEKMCKGILHSLEMNTVLSSSQVDHEAGGPRISKVI